MNLIVQIDLLIDRSRLEISGSRPNCPGKLYPQSHQIALSGFSIGVSEVWGTFCTALRACMNSQGSSTFVSRSAAP